MHPAAGRNEGAGRQTFPLAMTALDPYMGSQRWRFVAMPNKLILAFYVLAMVLVIVGADIAFFRDRFWARLLANLGIVLVFAAFYLRFLRH
jgi:hypothetical protein